MKKLHDSRHQHKVKSKIWLRIRLIVEIKWIKNNKIKKKTIREINNNKNKHEKTKTMQEMQWKKLHEDKNNITLN